MKNKLLDIIVLIISAIIFISFLIFSHGITALMGVANILNFKWISMGLFCMILFWFLEAAILYIIIRTVAKGNNLGIKTLKIAMTGQFFSAITPLQSGGQPAQLFAMKENGVITDCSGSILIVKFIIHQATFILYSLFAVLFTFHFFSTKISYFLPFCILGFIINIIILLVLLMSVSSRAANNKAINGFIHFILKMLMRLRIIKNSSTTLSDIKSRFEHMHECAAFISTNVRVCGYAAILTFLQWTVFYSIPYCIYRSFGNHSAGLPIMLAAQILLALFMSFIPLPGAAGGAEGGFFIIFGIFFKPNMIVPGIVIWRVLTYYLTIAIGALFTVVPSFHRGSKSREES